MKSLVYLILGAAGSGRRAVVADLVEGGLGADDRVLSLLGADEPAGADDGRLGVLARWTWDGDRIETPDLDGATHAFFFADGRGNPVDQVEAFAAWLPAQDATLGRVFSVVHCGLAAQHKALLQWFDACVHFSDVVLFNRREGLPNKWMSDFQARYTSQFLPCLFELVKGGRIDNPALVLEPQARRMTHLFDGEPDWEVAGDDEDEKEGEDIEAHAEVDPWLERWASGRRVKVLPDIKEYLA